MWNPRLDQLNDYPFDRLRALLGDATPPAGVRPLVMSIGEPQHCPPALVAEVLAAHAPLWGKYPPVEGTPAFREAVTAWLGRRYGVPAGTVGVLPLSGTREGLFMTGALTVPETVGGRTPAVLMPNPFYQVYSGAAIMAGAEPIFLSATAINGFLPDLDAVTEDTWTRTALLFLCSPANPQGAVADAAYLQKAIALARDFGFVLAVDECYGEIYDRVPPPGALEVALALGGSFANLLVFHSLSKRSNVPGLRSGFVAGDPELIDRFKRLRSYGGATLPMPVLEASAALWRDEAHVAENRALYRAKFDHASSLLQGRLGFRRPEGGFFLWLNVGDGEAAAKRLWQEAGVRVLPGAYLARPDASGVNPGAPYIRVALVHEPEIAAEGLTRLVEVVC